MMCRRGIAATSDTYDGLLEACLRSPDVDMALVIFEWMVEGRGATQPIHPSPKTYLKCVLHALQPSWPLNCAHDEDALV